MPVPVRLERANGHYTASVLGHESVRVQAPTRELALAAILDEIRESMKREEIVFVDVVRPFDPATGATEEGYGEYMTEICDEIYRARAAERALEFPE
jgi:hypothetical protein